MKLIFKGRNDHKTSTGWEYPPETEPMEFETLQEFVEWADKVELGRFEFIPPNADLGIGAYNYTPYWMVYTQNGYD